MGYNDHGDNNNFEIQKEELALTYISAWKKELSDNEQKVIVSIEIEMKDVLISPDKTIDESIKQFESLLSADMVRKIRIFLQEKKEILSKTNTIDELNRLKHDVQTAPYESDPLNQLKVVGVGGAGELAQRRASSKIEKQAIKTIAELEPELKRSTQEVLKSLTNKLKDPELTLRQKRTINKLIKDFGNAEKHLSSASALPLWKDLVDKKILGVDMLSKIKISPKTIEELKLIKSDVALLGALSGKTSQEIKTILANKGYKNISSKVIDILADGAQKGALENTIHVLSEAKGLSYISKALRRLPILDLVMIGYDTYEFSHQEKNTKNTTHYIARTAIWGSMAGYTMLAASGPTGRVVGLAIAADLAIDHAMDVGYFDLDDHYHQKKEDLLIQEKMQLKLALTTAIAGSGTRSDLSINEDTYDLITQRRGKDDGKKSTAEHAMYALVYSDEKNKSRIEPIEGEDPTVFEQRVKQDIDNRVELRMEYLKSYLPGGDQVSELSRRMYKSQGIGTIEQLLSDSDVYKEMKLDTSTQATTIDTYKNSQLEQIKSENPTLFATLEKFIQDKPLEAAEFLQHVEIYGIAAKEDRSHSVSGQGENGDITQHSDTENPEEDSELINEEDPLSYYTSETAADQTVESEDDENEQISVDEQDERNTILQVIDFVDRYKKAKSLSTTLPAVKILEHKFKSTEEMILDLANGKDITTRSKNYEEQYVKENLVNNMDDMREYDEYSSDLRQNIIYRIAKQFHGYTGPNNMDALIEYFITKKEGDENWKGIYYNIEKGQRMINNDYAIDETINFQDLEKQSVDDFMDYNFREKSQSSGREGIQIPQHDMPIKDMIDTPTETPDTQLNQELFDTIKKIVTEEKQALNPSYKASIDKEIHDYLESNIQAGYVKLPGYLCQKAERVGLGHLAYWYFTKKEGKLIALTTNDYMSRVMGLSGIEKQYINDADGKEKTLNEEQIKNLVPQTLAPVKKEIIEKTNLIIERIKKTAGQMMRSGRGEVTYDPLTEQLTSRKVSTKISEKNGKYILDDGKLKLEYNNIDEAINMAIVKNRFQGKYLKEHSDMNLRYQRYMGIGPKGLRDINNGGSHWYTNDTKLLTEEFIKKYLPGSFANETNQKIIIDYLST